MEILYRGRNGDSIGIIIGFRVWGPGCLRGNGGVNIDTFANTPGRIWKGGSTLRVPRNYSGYHVGVFTF